MPPRTHRAWPDDEIGFAIRDWLITFGRLPQPQDWQRSRRAADVSRYGALRADGRARWPSAKTVLRRFSTWEDACSHALVGDNRLVGLEPETTRVNVDEAVKALIDTVATEKVATLLEEGTVESQTVTDLAMVFHPRGLRVWNSLDGEPRVPPPLSNYLPTML